MTRSFLKSLKKEKFNILKYDKIRKMEEKSLDKVYNDGLLSSRKGY